MKKTDRSCRLREEEEETFDHFVNECPCLRQHRKEYFRLNKIHQSQDWTKQKYTLAWGNKKEGPNPTNAAQRIVTLVPAIELKKNRRILPSYFKYAFPNKIAFLENVYACNGLEMKTHSPHFLQSNTRHGKE